MLFARDRRLQVGSLRHLAAGYLVEDRTRLFPPSGGRCTTPPTGTPRRLCHVISSAVCTVRGRDPNNHGSIRG